MKNRNTIIGMILCSFLLCVCMNRLQTQTELVDINRTDRKTKIVELREDGHYERITETFIDGVLFCKKSEVSTKDNGKFDRVFTSYYQDGKKILFTTVDNKIIVHNYRFNDKTVMMEGDEDGDNLFETVILFDDKERPKAVFKRDKKGMVVPLCEKELSEWMGHWPNLDN